jgi:hypothetical protein
MNRLPLLLLLMIFCAPLLAQSTGKAPQEERYANITLIKYCAGVDSVSASLQTRMFAQVYSGLGSSSGWTEFESKAAWQRAGKPKPIALVWYKDDNVVRVAITTSNDDGQSYADYCYRPDGSLAQFRSVPAVQTKCDQSLFHCDVTLRGGLELYPPKGILVTRPELLIAPVEIQDWNLFDLFPPRTLKSEQSTFSFAPIQWPAYMHVSDLPFSSLLFVSAK